MTMNTARRLSPPTAPCTTMFRMEPNTMAKFASDRLSGYFLAP